MKKLIATMALASLGAGLAVGAQAQTTGTVTGNPATLYSINVTATVTDKNGTVVASPTVAANPGAGALYTYTYVATLGTNSSNGSVDTFTIGGIQGFAGGASAIGSGFDTVTPTTNPAGLTSITYQASGATGSGLTVPGDKTTLAYKSTIAPFGTIGLTPSQNTTGGGPGIGSKFIGPGTIIPETSSFALLGLGLLPLGMLARRRIANRA